MRLGRNSIVFINCEVASDALTALGEDREDTRDFTIVGCYEIASYGKEVPCSCNARINLPKALEVTLFEGVDPLCGRVVGENLGKTTDFETFDSLFDAYLTQCDFFADTVMNMVRTYESAYKVDMASPALSSTFEDCVKKGRDAYNASGAKYNNSSINAFGLATAADSLLAIKRLVFDEKRLTLSRLSEILKANWEGHDDLRRKIVSDIPKYGNNIDEVADSVSAPSLSTGDSALARKHSQVQTDVSRASLYRKICAHLPRATSRESPRTFFRRARSTSQTRQTARCLTSHSTRRQSAEVTDFARLKLCLKPLC